MKTVATSGRLRARPLAVAALALAGATSWAQSPTKLRFALDWAMQGPRAPS